MGKLIYDSTTAIDFDDRLLTHMQIVIGTKLRRNESFFLSWRDDQDAGDGRSAIWLNPGLPLRFKFVGGRMPTINREWIDALTHSANSPGGMMALPEPSGSDSRGSAPSTSD